MKIKKLAVFFEGKRDLPCYREQIGICIQSIYERFYQQAMNKFGMVVDDMERAKICCYDSAVAQSKQEIAEHLQNLLDKIWESDTAVDLPVQFRRWVYYRNKLLKLKWYQGISYLILVRKMRQLNVEVPEQMVIVHLAYHYVCIDKYGVVVGDFCKLVEQVAAEKWLEFEKVVKSKKI